MDELRMFFCLKKWLCVIIGTSILFSSYARNIDEFVQINDKISDSSQYMTAGHKLYVVGNQDGSFPEIVGWHEKGEMGGVWSLPIKLLDGFELSVQKGNLYTPIRMNRFMTYPYKNVLISNKMEKEIDIICEQFIPDSDRALSINYRIVNKSASLKSFNFRFTVRVDLRGGFFSNTVGIINGKDSVWFDKNKNLISAKDLTNFWFCGITSDVKFDNVTITPAKDSKGDEFHICAVDFNIKVPANNEIDCSFYIAGSDESNNDVLSSLNNIINNKSELIATKKKQYTEIINRTNITLPDKKMQEVFNWTRFNAEWMVLDVPKMGIGLMAGIPHYPWYFSADYTYTFQALLATGDFERVKSGLRLIRNQSFKANKNGKVVHSVTPDEAVCNDGNTQETAHFVMAVWKTFLWTGDINFLKEFYPYILKNIKWLLEVADTNHNLFPEGYGIMEVAGLNAELIDVAVYTQQALLCVSKMALLFGDDSDSVYYKSLSDKLKDKINDLFWDDNLKLYCDFYGTAGQAIKTVNGSIEQYSPKGNNAGLYEAKTDKGQLAFYKKIKEYFESFSEDYEHGWLTNKNWVINTPMETGIAPYSKAIAALNTMESSDFTSQWGPYLSAVNKNHSMTIATGVQAVAECRYNRVDNGIRHVNQVVNTFNRNMPGSITEMMPDYGCFVIGWTVYALAVPLMEYVYGITPDAYNKRVVLKPQTPTGWDSWSVSNQKIGNTSFNWKICSNVGDMVYELNWEDKNWGADIVLPYNCNNEYFCNGKAIEKPRIIDGNIIISSVGDVVIKVVNKYV